MIPGQTPPAYVPQNEKGGGAGRGRSPQAEDGRRRKLSYPPAPEPLPLPVVDNHTHLDFRDGLLSVSLGDALDAAEAVGVEGVVQVGCDVESSRWAVRAAEADRRVLAAVAIHPNDAARAGQALTEQLAVIDELAAHPRVRAIGETGLDYFRTGPEGHAAQEESFREHLRIAERHGLPLQIHDRDAHEDVIRVLLDVRPQTAVVFHAYSGDEQMARLAASNGWYLSFGGTSTFKGNDELRRALSSVGRDRLLVETDAPFLTAVPYRGRPNAPYMIPYAVAALAETRGEELEALCAALRANTEAVYGAF